MKINNEGGSEEGRLGVIGKIQKLTSQPACVASGGKCNEADSSGEV